MTTTVTKRLQRFAGSASLAVIAISLGAPSAMAQNAWDAEGFDLDALIAAAQAEPAITVYDSTGKIVEIAEAFSAAYGVEATGVKVSTGAQIDQVMREGQSGNVVGDVVVVQDVPPGMAQLVPMGLFESWVPPDLAEFIPEGMQDPVIIVSSPNVWTYNTETYESCPVANIWELTEPEWNRKIAMQDPLGKPTYTDWFNQMETHFDDAVAAAYESYYGAPLETDEASATKAWVKALAANSPLLTDSDSTAGDAVGARGQDEPFMGMMATAKFRDNAPDGLALGLCDGLEPFSGWMYPGIGMIATGTDSPNASRLFIRYLLTEEGIAPQSVDGKISSNSQVPAHSDEPSGVGEHMEEMMPYNTATAIEDFDTRQDWQDFWRLNYDR
ncbi:ABC transporter substrate-binding protein [Pelagibacterium luteolum]|uniref:Iron(III) transport system substrate-binding protein n=1 Tax=Pelagibacterium luteolum TaxID=440168 RepID=A0A1G7XXC5_9HYPH|nr:ABC transporter substrate-binding protein [Pelagibacterium luteolum]SDG88834.1 iron(III) transport system substrate-binding protein [Pelagibacterium luteolum]